MTQVKDTAGNLILANGSFDQKDRSLLAGWHLVPMEDFENIVTRRIDIQYLEQRYLSLEKEIADALLHSPADDLTVADLKCRKLIIADEIEETRRSVERIDLVN